MGEVDKEEMTQWVEEMLSLHRAYAGVTIKTVLNLGEELTKAKEASVKVELPALLEKLREMPTPKVRKCGQTRNNFMKAIHAQMVAWAIDNQFGFGTLVASDWQAKSRGYRKNVIRDVFSLAEKYQNATCQDTRQRGEYVNKQ